MNSIALRGFFVWFDCRDRRSECLCTKARFIAPACLLGVLDLFIMRFYFNEHGVLGLGSLISQSHIATLMLSLGAAFLLWYGFRAFKSAHQGTSALALDDQRQTHALGKTITTTHA